MIFIVLNPLCVCGHVRDEHDDEGNCEATLPGGDDCFCFYFEEDLQ